MPHVLSVALSQILPEETAEICYVFLLHFVTKLGHLQPIRITIMKGIYISCAQENTNGCDTMIQEESIIAEEMQAIYRF